MARDIYDDLDLLYREIWGESLHHGLWIEGNESPPRARDQLIELILSRLKPRGTIADIGCGYGVLAHRLIREFSCEVIANTASQIQLERIKAHPNLTVLGGDWLRAALSPACLDGAIAIESFSHFPDFEAALAKASSTLKPGSSLVIADWFSESGRHPMLKHLARRGGLPDWRPLTSVIEAARSCGLQVEQCLDRSSQAGPTWSHLFRRALTTPFVKPRLFPHFLLQLLRNPALLWTFPLLRLAYETGDLQYQIVFLKKESSLSSRGLS